METPETVGEHLDKILADATEMAPYYQALGEPDDGTIGYLEGKLSTAPWHGPLPPGMQSWKAWQLPTGLQQRGVSSLRAFLRFGFDWAGYYGTKIDCSHDQDILNGGRSKVRDFLERYERDMMRMPPYVQAANMLAQLVGQRERHESALQEGYAYHNSGWIWANLSKNPWERKAGEPNLWRSAIHGINRRTGVTITNGRLHDGGDSVRQPCFVNSSTYSYVPPILTFTRNEYGRRVLVNMRDWLFKFEPLAER